MRILLINDFYEGGGAETNINAIIKFLKKDHQIFLFSFGETYQKTKGKLILPKAKNKFIAIIERFFFSFRIKNALKNYIKEINPDIIHLHNNYAYSNSVLSALKETNIPIIQTVHDWGLICPTAWSVIQKNLKVCPCYEGISFKCLQCLKPGHFFLTYFRNKKRISLSKKIIKLFISPSTSLRDDLKLHNFKNVIYLPHFIEFKTKTSDKKDLLYVGVLSKNKGVEYLIKAMPEITEKFPKIKLNIAGNGPEKNNLEQLTKKINLKNVTFLGKVPHNKVIELYRSSILVMPSIWMENSPFVLYEALTASCPIIASNRGGIPDLAINNFNALLIKPADSKELAKAITKLLLSKSLMQKFGKNSKKLVEKEFNTKKHLTSLKKIYSKYKK